MSTPQTAPTAGTPNKLGHALALITVTVWGLTFVSTKVLLRSFEPVEILFCRFLIGFLALSVIRPHVLKAKNPRHHLLFMAAGLCGVCLYFMLENIALVYATASNISVTVAVAPMFTAIVATVVFKKRSLTRNFVAGFVLAMVGIVFTSTGDVSSAQAGWGDVLAIVAACCWAFYSNIINKLTDLGYETIAVTKRCFAWGLLFILVALPIFGFSWDFSRFLQVENITNLLFLGLVASAGCFAMWGYCVTHLGAAKTSAYIYLSPGITVIAGVIILGEPLTAEIIIGLALVLGGLILSERPAKPKPAAK